MKIKTIISLLIFILAILIERFLPHSDLLPLAIIIIAAWFDKKWSLWLALSLGIILELYSPYTFGVYLVSLVFCAWLASYLSQNLFSVKTKYSLISLALLCYAAYDFCFIVLSHLLATFGRTANSWQISFSSLGSLILWQVILSVIIIALLNKSLEKWAKIF